ncbi:hypothetical protein C8Q76DRAFT_160117 [Earliella scabrosa]|nr:hypothetical protein C8Q76DRAFT_160117 [Earliella scabrosa]
MALVMHSTPGDSPRRSPRIRVRRQTNLSRPSCVRTHTQTAVSRPVLARSTHPSNLPPDALLVLASKHAAPKSGLRSSLSHSQSQREPHNARTRASSSSSTAASSSRTKSPSKKKAAVRLPDLSPSLPVVAGTKRKRSHSRPVPAYELVSARPEADEEAQTPRQLRYAKRQRLLVARSGTDAPAASAGCSRTLVNDPSQRGDASSIRKVDERAGSRERVLHRASTVSQVLIPVCLLCLTMACFFTGGTSVVPSAIDTPTLIYPAERCQVSTAGTCPSSR